MPPRLLSLFRRAVADRRAVSLEPQMSKRKKAVPSKRAQSNRKPATAPKRARQLKVATRAQRNKQAFVRSSRPLRAVNAGRTEPPIEVHNEPKQETPRQETANVDNRERAVALEAILQAALQDDLSKKMRENNPKKGFDFGLLISNVQAYQAKLLEVTQANTQFVFELSQRLATIRSPFEFWAIIAEFTGRLIIMIGKYSKELAAFWRIDAFRELRQPA